MAPPHDFAPFEVLLRAPDKNAVGTSLDAVASGSLLLEGPRSEMAAAWGLTEAEVQRYAVAARKLLVHAVYNELDEAGVAAVFPDDFHAQLRALLAKAVAARLPEWRKDLMANPVTLPVLTDVNWRVDVKSASNYISRMNAPTCLVDLQVDHGMKADGSHDVRHVNFELGQDTLQTMVDGLSKIRDQLNALK